MTIPTGAVSLSDIQAEFGGANPASLSEYYAGGSYVSNPAPTSASQTAAIPTSGAISLGMFKGVTKFSPVTISEFGTQVDMYGHGNGPWAWSTFRQATGSAVNATNLHFILIAGGGRPAQNSSAVYTWSFTKISGTAPYTAAINNPGAAGSEIAYPSPLTTAQQDRKDFTVGGNSSGQICGYRISVTDGITTATKDIYCGFYW